MLQVRRQAHLVEPTAHLSHVTCGEVFDDDGAELGTHLALILLRAPQRHAPEQSPTRRRHHLDRRGARGSRRVERRERSEGKEAVEVGVGEEVREQGGRSGDVEHQVVHRLEQRRQPVAHVVGREHATSMQCGEKYSHHLTLALRLVHGEHHGALDDVEMERGCPELFDAACGLDNVCRAQAEGVIARRDRTG